MILLKKLIANKYLVLFLTVHTFLFNINAAEWGDSYRILRASEYIRNFSYPKDEKRQPVYSLILALRPDAIDQVVWGRIIMFGVSAACFYYFSKLLTQFKLSQQAQDLAYLLFIFNPVFLYWSIRIMADVFFALLVLLTFFYFQKYKDENKLTNLLITGVLLAISVLTRFEGYILGFSIGLALVLAHKPSKIKVRELLTVGASFLVVSAPWLLYRNPITSSYFEEPANRSYDLNALVIYISSLIFLFGFTLTPLFLFSKKVFTGFLYKKHVHITAFIILELLLALAWPAAIPRLFVPIIPFLVLLIAEQIPRFFAGQNNRVNTLLFSCLACGFFILTQVFFKLQFLVATKELFVFVFLLQLGLILFLYLKTYKYFYATLFLSLLAWALAVIFAHKDIFRAVKQAANYASENLQGRVAYNDVSSVSDWYLNTRKADSVFGFYLNMDSKGGRSRDKLLEKEADYILITNEHNHTLVFDDQERGDLELLTEFSYTTNGKLFFTKIFKVNR